MTREEALSGRGFGVAAADYVAGRPDYPASAVEWLVGDAEEVVDVGAGTGKLTASLVAPGRTVTAVEPDPAMLATLRGQVPAAVAVQGAAEALPLPDASADTIVYGQAWHWVDVPRASAEAARVLRPGGVLGLVWNVRDSSVPWVDELGAIMRNSAAEELIRGEGVRVAPPFGALDRRTWQWARPMTEEQLVAMAASRSYVIALDEPERRTVLDRVRALFARQRAGGTVELPYTTVAFRASLPDR